MVIWEYLNFRGLIDKRLDRNVAHGVIYRYKEGGVPMKYKELWHELVKGMVDGMGSNDYTSRVASFAWGMSVLDGEKFTIDGKKFRVICDEGILTVKRIKGKKSEVCWETELTEEDIALVLEFAEKGWYLSEKRDEILYEFLKGLGFKVE